MSARERDRWPSEALPDVQDVALDPLAVYVPLTRNLLGRRQYRLDPAKVDKHRPGILALLDYSSDDVAFLPGELSESELVLGIAQALEDDLPRGSRGNSSETCGGVVVFPDPQAVLIGLRRPDGDVAGVPVNSDARGWRGALALVIRDEQGILDGLDYQVHRDVLLGLHAAQDRYVNVHLVPPRPDRRRTRRDRRDRRSRRPRGGRTPPAPGLVRARRSSPCVPRRRSPA